MKIGFVIDDTLDKPDGVQQYVLDMGAWLSRHGHEVHYLAGRSERTDVPHVHSLGRTRQVRFNGNRLNTPLPASRRRIKQLLDREQFDVLHVQMPFSPLLAGRVVRLAGPRTAVIGTFHILPYGRLVRMATRLLGWWLRPSLRRFDRVFAVSPDAAAFARQAFGLTAVDVLPNATDVPKFAAAEPLARYDDGRPTLMFLGRLVPRKGCQTFLQAAALVRQRLGAMDSGGLWVVVCGKGPLLPELQALARQLQLDDITEFTGFVSEADKPRYIASADVIVFPSSGGESFGIVLIEAMASGRPVVLAGDNPGYRSVLGARPELLFPARDVEALAGRLMACLQDAGSRAAHVAWQRQYVKQFDVAVVGRRLEQACHQALKEKAIS